ncbi:MBL fold metallo-hydrolase [Candidatus Woesearchaeota archaeon]|nr:MBL fold metallo-hydrolase [Candidatus Woesearchaeota archaeon]
MKLTKIFHSCILIEEKINSNTVKILIDPGTWMFSEKWAKPEDFSDVDIVLVTHEHQDHYDPKSLKVICSNN